MAFPIPRAAPVTMATRPSSLALLVIPLVLLCQRVARVVPQVFQVLAADAEPGQGLWCRCSAVPGTAVVEAFDATMDRDRRPVQRSVVHTGKVTGEPRCDPSNRCRKLG